MKQIVMEYKKSLKLLTERINELNNQKDMLARKSYSPERECNIDDIRDRLKPLNAMLKDLKAVTKEVEHYYDRSWWRSEEFTLNQR